MVSLTTSSSDAEVDLIKMAFEGVFLEVKLSHGWRFHVECQRRWSLTANGLRPIVAVVLENTGLPEGHEKRLICVKAKFERQVRSRVELKPVVMECFRRLLEQGMSDGLSECWFDGADVARPS